MGNLFGNTLFYGDNLPIMRAEIDTGSVDLVYLDPPFNSQQSYNVLFPSRQGGHASAQIHAFNDTWHWSEEAERTLFELMHGESAELANLAQALRAMLGKGDMLAYLVMMAPRLVELRRVLKPTGSLYLHCDPTSSHYLKLLLDAVFGPRNFRNEIIWKRTTSHSSAKKFAPVHDTILCYRNGGTPIWTDPRVPNDPKYLKSRYRYDDGDGRLYARADLTAAGTRNGSSGMAWRGFDVAAKGNHWKFTIENLEALDATGRIYWPPGGAWPRYKRYLDELQGLAVADVWTDIEVLNAKAAERLGFSTQKPLALLERIISASSNPGDLVLDPFCGCGTTVDAAQKLDRHWIGIDVSTLAIDIIDRRLRDNYGNQIAYEIRGIPRDVEGARALFGRDPFEFERWAVLLLEARPNTKQVGDKGLDGTAWFWTGEVTDGRILISVKGGAVNPGFVRDLAGTVEGHGAQMGLMVTLRPPTKGMSEAASMAGFYTHPNGQRYPRVQLMTVDQLLKGERPNWPPMLRGDDASGRATRPAAAAPRRRVQAG
jgi:DNA modification methylase